MPIKADKIPGFLVEKKHCGGTEKELHICQAINEVIDEMSPRKLTLNREGLARTLSSHRGGHKGFPPASWDYDLADAIIANESTLIEYRGKL